MKHLFLAVGGLCAVLAGVLLLDASGSPPAAPAQALEASTGGPAPSAVWNMTEEVRQLQLQVRRLEREVARLDRELQGSARERAAVADAHAGSDGAVTAEPGAGTEIEESEEAMRWLDALDERVDLERSGMDQAPRLERDLRSAFTQGTSRGNELLELQCSRTLCRVLLEHETPGEREGFLESLSSHLPVGVSSRVQALDDEGRAKTLIYVASAGGL